MHWKSATASGMNTVFLYIFFSSSNVTSIHFSELGTLSISTKLRGTPSGTLLKAPKDIARCESVALSEAEMHLGGK